MPNSTMPSPMKDSPWKMPVRSLMSMRKTFSTVRVTTTAESGTRTRLAPRPQPRHKQRYPEGEPHRRIGVLLRVADLAAAEHLALIEHAHLEREIGECECDRGHRRGGAIPLRPHAARR